MGAKPARVPPRESSPRSPRESLPFLSADYWRRWGRWIGRGVPIVSGGLRIPTFLMMAVLCVRGALTLLWTMEACQRLRRIGGRITRILCDICRWAEFYLSPLPEARPGWFPSGVQPHFFWWLEAALCSHHFRQSLRSLFVGTWRAFTITTIRFAV